MKCPHCGAPSSQWGQPLKMGSFAYVIPMRLPMTETPHDPLLVERKKTHGSFKDNAMIAQELKEIMRQPRPGIHPPSLSVHREALDMIALKLSRILSGQANFKDHWQDISGYALLAMEACDK